MYAHHPISLLIHECLEIIQTPQVLFLQVRLAQKSPVISYLLFHFEQPLQYHQVLCPLLILYQRRHRNTLTSLFREK